MEVFSLHYWPSPGRPVIGLSEHVDKFWREKSTDLTKLKNPYNMFM